jgi:hypothetical protein
MEIIEKEFLIDCKSYKVKHCPKYENVFIVSVHCLDRWTGHWKSLKRGPKRNMLIERFKNEYLKGENNGDLDDYGSV